MKKYRVGIIGLGARGSFWVNELLWQLNTIEINGICDLYGDRTEDCRRKLNEKGIIPSVITCDFKALIESPEIDVVLVFSAWRNHIEAAIASMKQGKPVACEVGGAYSVEQCRELVKTQEETGVPFMLLENCCYDRNELMIHNMVRHGLFGEIIHCDGGYMHDLRDEITRGNENRHYRFGEYKNRCCENYPTHEIGPIAKILGINNGNRFVSLVSVASKAAGLHEYIESHEELKEKYSDVKFMQGDICTTVITCANGETVTITLDTSLPRYYSRNFTVRGTKGMFEESTRSVFLDTDEDRKFDFDWMPQHNNIGKYRDEWEHPIWKKYEEAGVKEQGHGGMDFLVIDAFFTALSEGLPMPIDVYDAAAWMCISALSEKSLLTGSMPVEFPDFTDGKWYTVKPEPNWKYSLDV